MQLTTDPAQGTQKTKKKKTQKIQKNQRKWTQPPGKPDARWGYAQGVVGVKTSCLLYLATKNKGKRGH